MDITTPTIPDESPRRVVNYAEADKVKSVSTFFGFKVVEHEDIPENECHVVVKGEVVHKIILTD